MRNIIKRSISANVILAMTLFSVVAPSDLCNAASQKTVIDAKFCLGNEGSVTKKFRSIKELDQYFDSNKEQAEAVQLDLGYLDQLNSENVKESIDNGCVIYLNTDSYKKLRKSKFIKKCCSDILSAEYEGIDVEGISLQNNGGDYSASVYGKSTFYCSSKKKTTEKTRKTDFKLKEVLDIVKNQYIEDSQMINNKEMKKKGRHLELQVPKGALKHNSVVSPNYKPDGTKLGVSKIVQYLYKGKKSGRKTLSYAVTTFTVSPTEKYAVKLFDAEMATGADNKILDESYLQSDAPNTSYSINATIPESISIGFTSSYSTSGMDIINSFAYDKKRKWSCKPQSMVKEQARKIETSIAVENPDYKRNMSKYISRITAVTYKGLLGWSLNDGSISVTDYISWK